MLRPSSLRLVADPSTSGGCRRVHFLTVAVPYVLASIALSVWASSWWVLFFCWLASPVILVILWIADAAVNKSSGPMLSAEVIYDERARRDSNP